MTPALQLLFDERVGLALDRQAHLLTLLADAQWSFDMARGTIAFESAAGASELREPPPLPMVRLVTGWARVLAVAGEQIADQPCALRAYGRSLGFEAERGPDSMRLTGPEGAVEAAFGPDGRTVSIRALPER